MDFEVRNNKKINVDDPVNICRYKYNFGKGYKPNKSGRGFVIKNTVPCT